MSNQTNKINKKVEIDLVDLLKKDAPYIVEDGKVNLEKLKDLLSGKITEKEDDRFYFNWAGKDKVFQAIQAPAYSTLAPQKDKSIGWDETENLMIVGENLETLKLLLKPYFGKVKVIYIDPPYNTGKDFIYKDDFSSPLKDYLERTGQKGDDGTKLTTNSETNGRYHSDWLNFMYPRLFLARNLLKDDGVIFISIDDNEVHHLRMIMDEIFGEDNFVAEITRATGTTTGQDAKKFGSSLDYVLVYRKTDLFIPAGLPLTDKDKKRFRFDDNDGKGKYALLQLRKTGSGDRKEDRPNMFYGIKSPSGELVFPIGPTNYLSRWRVDKNTYDKFVKNNLIVWKQEEIEENEIEELEWELGFDDNGKENKTSKGVDNLSKNVPYKKSTWIPYVKYYLEGRKKRPSNLWIDIDGNKKGSLELKQLFSERIFDNPKPTQLIKRIINLSSNKEGLIIDFFAGSGTTGQAVWELNKEDDGNRKFILVQLDEPVNEKKETGKNAKKLGFDTIADICIERLKRVSQKIKAEDEGRLIKENSKLDLGFRVLSLKDLSSLSL